MLNYDDLFLFYSLLTIQRKNERPADRQEIQMRVGSLPSPKRAGSFENYGDSGKVQSSALFICSKSCAPGVSFTKRSAYHICIPLCVSNIRLICTDFVFD